MKIFANILRMLILLLLQVLLFNHLSLGGLCHPYIYIIGLICMPLMPRWLEMLIAALVGLLMDCVCSSLGIHVAACVLMAYLRPLLVAAMVQDAERVVQDITASSIGYGQFIRLAVILCLLHHAVVFTMDAWTLSGLHITFFRWLISSAITLFFLLIYGVNHRD